jgi:Heterokaryon incompatibility protein (HET)
MPPAQDCGIFTHTPLTVEGRAIRLLDLLPSSDPSSEIQCKLWNVDLDERPSYKALSYVWGDPENTVQILVDGKSYNVTVNCEAALYRLRETHESSLWIDAICINQKDDDEKTTQIPLMRDIYAFADEVIVWLGHCKAEQSPDDEKRERIGFGLMEDLSICEDNITDFPSLLEFALRAPDPISRWQSVREIYAHTWFDRLWVHQEITLALRASVLGQHYSTSWVKLSRVVLVIHDYLDTPALLLNKDPILDLWKPIVMGIVQRDLVLRCLHYSFRHQGETILNRAKSLLKNLEESLDLELSLFDLLKATRRFKCYNPLDRVFANLGLTKDDMGLRPHYSQTVSEVFTNVTLVAVKKQQSLKALCLAGLGRSSKTNFPEVPSWVIDWRLESEQPSSLETMHIELHLL